MGKEKWAAEPVSGFCKVKSLDQLRLWLWVTSGWRCQQRASEEAAVGPRGAAGLWEERVGWRRSLELELRIC